MTEFDLAFVAYEANRALCISFRNYDLASWDMAAPRHKMEMIYAVLWIARNPMAGPADFHAYRAHVSRTGDAENAPPAERLVVTEKPLSDLTQLQSAAFRLIVSTVRSLERMYNRAQGYETRTQAALEEAAQMSEKTKDPTVAAGTLGNTGDPIGPLAPPEDDEGHGMLHHQRP